MNKCRLTITVLFSIITFLIKAQCVGTPTPVISFGGPATYTLGQNGIIGPYQICSGAIVYDTLGTTQRYYYLLPGATLYLKNTYNNYVFMKGNSNVVRMGFTGGSTTVYKEALGFASGNFTPAVTNCTTGAGVTFPTITCAPPPATTTVNEFDAIDFISVYPNPATDELTINNDFPVSLTITLSNTLGYKVREITVESEKKKIGLEGLPQGIYFLTITGQGNISRERKVIVSR